MRDIEDLRPRLLEGVPPLVCGMADAIIAEWEQAVSAVPELARLAAEDLANLAGMPAAGRERELRRRWLRLHEGPVAEVVGRALEPAGTGRVVAAR